MKFLPADDITRFQLFSMLFLVAALASTFISAAAFAVTFALFAPLCVLISKPLVQAQRKQAYALFGIFAIFGAGALVAGKMMSSPSQALGAMPFLGLGFLALYVIVKRYVVDWRADCKVIGYSEGYAIVEVAPSVMSAIPAGIIAVKSRPVAKGKKAHIVFERRLFGPAAKPAGLEPY